MAVRLIIRMEAEKIDDAHTAPGRGNPLKKSFKAFILPFFLKLCLKEDQIYF